MAPAMRVTVRDAVGRHQATRVSQGFQNVGNRFPDVLAAEQGEVGGIGAIALHRVQNLVVGQALGDAGVEVFYSVSG